MWSFQFRNLTPPLLIQAHHARYDLPYQQKTSIRDDIFISDSRLLTHQMWFLHALGAFPYYPAKVPLIYDRHLFSSLILHQLWLYFLWYNCDKFNLRVRVGYIFTTHISPNLWLCTLTFTKFPHQTIMMAMMTKIGEEHFIKLAGCSGWVVSNAPVINGMIFSPLHRPLHSAIAFAYIMTMLVLRSLASTVAGQWPLWLWCKNDILERILSNLW